MIKTRIKVLSKRSLAIMLGVLILVTSIGLGSLITVIARSGSTMYVCVSDKTMANLEATKVYTNAKQNQYQDQNNWTSAEMTATNKFYNGKRIYSIVGVEDTTWGGLGCLQILLKNDSGTQKAYKEIKANDSTWWASSNYANKLYNYDSGSFVGTYSDASYANGFSTGDYYIHNNVTGAWYGNGVDAPKMTSSGGNYYYDFYLKKNEADTTDYLIFKFWDASDELQIGPDWVSGHRSTLSTNDTWSSSVQSITNYIDKDTAWQVNTSGWTTGKYNRVRITLDPTTLANDRNGRVKFTKTELADMNPTFSETEFSDDESYDLTSMVGITSGSNVGSVSYGTYQYYDGTWHDISTPTSWTPDAANITKLRVTATDNGVVSTAGTTQNAVTARTETKETNITVELNSDDYRAWSHHDTRWSAVRMGNSTVGNGGAPTTAITKLAIQAGLRDAEDFNVGSMATLLTENNGYVGSSIKWKTPAESSLNLFSEHSILQARKANDGTYNSSSNYSALRGYINNGWHLVIHVQTSNGTDNYVAVDEERTLASGSAVFIMDCLRDKTKNTNITLAGRYPTYIRVIGYKLEGVKVNLSGKASFNATYIKNGNTVSFNSGDFVPNGASVNVTATPNTGYNAANNWTISGGYSGTSTATTFSFTANQNISNTASIVYSPTAKTYNITYTYGENSESFNYNNLPTTATTGSNVNLNVTPKDDAYVYELEVIVKDSLNNEIPVTNNGNIYSFTMPASNITVTFKGKGVNDWRKWARDDIRWRDKEMANDGTTSYTVLTDGAVMVLLAKLAIQAGVNPAPATTWHKTATM